MRAEPDTDGMPRREGVMFEPGLQAHIGKKLREIYDEIAHEAVPDRFLDLLDQLERREADQP